MLVQTGIKLPDSFWCSQLVHGAQCTRHDPGKQSIGKFEAAAVFAAFVVAAATMRASQLDVNTEGAAVHFQNILSAVPLRILEQWRLESITMWGASHLF